MGKTLVREDKEWVIHHGPEDYKTGKDYGARPPMMVAQHLTKDLDEWWETWRGKLNPSHDFFFTTRGGKPLTSPALYQMFSTAARRVTGKPTNPHLVRDMIVTHIRNSDASERELEALAIYMGHRPNPNPNPNPSPNPTWGHSLAQQKGSYDRRTREQKVAPAVNLLRDVNADLLGGQGGQLT